VKCHPNGASRFFRPKPERGGVGRENSEFAPNASSVTGEIEQSYVTITKRAGESLDCLVKSAPVRFEHEVGFKSKFGERLTDGAGVGRRAHYAWQLPVFGNPDNKGEPPLGISGTGAQGCGGERRQKKRADHRRPSRVVQRQLTLASAVPPGGRRSALTRSGLAQKRIVQRAPSHSRVNLVREACARSRTSR
jgi:hypothetical protein